MIPAWRIKLDLLILTVLLILAGGCYLFNIGGLWMLLLLTFVWSTASELFYRKYFRPNTLPTYLMMILSFWIALGLALIIEHELIIDTSILIGLTFCAWFYIKTIRFLFDWINRPRSFWDLV